MTPDQQRSRYRQLAAAARALIAGDVGLVRAAVRIEQALRLLGPAAPSGFEIFAKFRDAVPRDIPLGSARLNWPIDLLVKLDERQTSIETAYRPALLRACAALIALDAQLEANGANLSFQRTATPPLN